MQKEKFEMPEMEVVEFDAEDVICTSDCSGFGDELND